MSTRRFVGIAAGVGLCVIILAIGFSYRYLLLSKLNISTGENEAVAGLHRVAEIPLTGSATRFDYQSIDLQDGMLFMAHMDAD